MRPTNSMKRHVRIALVVVVVALAAGWLALRRHNAELERTAAAPGEREVSR